MRVLITDDEAPARERLRRLLGEFADVELVGEAANGADALALSARLDPDLVLMDIRMPGIDGLEAAMHLADSERPPAVVFTTAYGDHALEAFEASAVDYLLKPIRRQRLAQALERAGTLRKAQLQAIRRRGEGARTHICVRGAGSIRLIPVGEVIYFRAEHKYTTVRHLHGAVLIDEALRSLEQEFAETFLRVHRNTLISKEYIEGIQKPGQGCHRLVLRGLEERPEVSRRHVAQVREMLEGRA